MVFVHLTKPDFGFESRCIRRLGLEIEIWQQEKLIEEKFWGKKKKKKNLSRKRPKKRGPLSGDLLENAAHKTCIKS